MGLCGSSLKHSPRWSPANERVYYHIAVSRGESAQTGPSRVNEEARHVDTVTENMESYSGTGHDSLSGPRSSPGLDDISLPARAETESTAGEYPVFRSRTVS